MNESESESAIESKISRPKKAVVSALLENQQKFVKIRNEVVAFGTSDTFILFTMVSSHVVIIICSSTCVFVCLSNLPLK